MSQLTTEERLMCSGVSSDERLSYPGSGEHHTYVQCNDSEVEIQACLETNAIFVIMCSHVAHSSFSGGNLCRGFLSRPK